MHCDALSTWMTFVFQMLLEHRMQGMPRVAGQLSTLWWKVRKCMIDRHACSANRCLQVSRRPLNRVRRGCRRDCGAVKDVWLAAHYPCPVGIAPGRLVCSSAVGSMQRGARPSSVCAAAALCIVTLLSTSHGALASRTGRHLTTAAAASRQLQQTAAATDIVSFTPAPITGVNAVADQAVTTTQPGIGATAPAALPITISPSPEPVPVVVPPVVLAPAPAPIELTNAEAWAKPWACGEADVNCRARSELAAVGASVVYDITVADGNVDDMIVIANSTDGHVDL